MSLSSHARQTTVPVCTRLKAAASPDSPWSDQLRLEYDNEPSHISRKKKKSPRVMLWRSVPTSYPHWEGSGWYGVGHRATHVGTTEYDVVL